MNFAVSEDTDLILVNDSGSVWGAPDRVDVAQVCLLYFMEPGSPVITVKADYTPGLDNTHISYFQFDYTTDGWYKVYLTPVPVNPTATNGNIRWSVADMELQIYNVDVWETLTDYTLLFTEESIFVENNYPLYSKNAKLVNCIWKDLVDKTCKTDKCSNEMFWFMRGQLYSALNQFMMGNRHEYHKMIQNVNRIAAQL